MTEQEAFEEITSKLKWYYGKYSSGYATQLKQRYAAGQLKQKTIDKLLNEFGYYKTKPAQWDKN